MSIKPKHKTVNTTAWSVKFRAPKDHTKHKDPTSKDVWHPPVILVAPEGHIIAFMRSLEALKFSLGALQFSTLDFAC